MEIPGTLLASAANFRMIDIGSKADTIRRAVASGCFYASAGTIARIRERSLPKGDVLALAEVAGIQGAKSASSILPLCHPLSLTSVRVWSEVGADRITVFCEAKTIGKTGVEMEALVGASAALLCIYDLTKGVDPVLRFGDIQLEIKEGGKSGVWVHPGSEKAETLQRSETPILDALKCVVLTLSDRCSTGESVDASGPLACEWLRVRGAAVTDSRVLPDDPDTLRSELRRILLVERPRLILTTGGTGLSPRDITPETVLELAREMGGREIPGIGELLRQSGASHTRSAWLSRSVGISVSQTLIICLPGKPKAVTEGLEAVADLIPHCLHMMSGGGHER